MSEQRTAIRIDIVSDVMCPWCYIGKKNLEAALPEVGDVEVEVHWRPYQLDPTLPPEGKDRAQYLSEKFGGEERARGIYKRVEDAGREAGIAFDFESIAVSPNTLDAHRLIRWAGGQGEAVQDKVVTRLFESYFTQGGRIGEHSVLQEIAREAGMNGELVAELLASPADSAEVRQEIAMAQQMGVTGVPCFILEGRHALMGAQPPQVLAQAIRQVAAAKAETNQYVPANGG